MCLGIPGEVTALSERDGLPYASVRFGGVTRDVCLACQPDVAPGDFVLVHVGLAIAKIDREQAASAWRVLEQIGATAEVALPPESSEEPEP
ncbi:MAG TPA: HypC/HybG/HupF family hydrogenase formation chaperone [Polyangia bacterium]|jgi:hydrogenase expression/formation protein HypC